MGQVAFVRPVGVGDAGNIVVYRLETPAAELRVGISRKSRLFFQSCDDVTDDVHVLGLIQLNY